MSTVGACPCGTGATLAACCGRYLDAGEVASSPEALMRSRYTAYVLERGLYLRASWHPRTRPSELHFDPGVSWLGLEVLRSAQSDDAHGVVEFIASSRSDGVMHRLHERSRFEKRRGVWLYVDGDVLE